MADELIAGRYELEELIARGGMADVFRARDRMLDRPVAVKVLSDRYRDDDTFVKRFRREAEAVAQLSHPNIVTVLDRGEENGRKYIVFELLSGEDLKTYLARVGPLPVATAISLASQIGRALAFAHAHGVVHRDVKPHNVIVDDGQAKMTDFGIARTAGAEDITVTGTVLGTGDYISPEQAGGLPADERSDVYSLGVVLYELLTGEVPFPSANPVAASHRPSEALPLVSAKRADVAPAVDAAVARAMERDPARRFQTMEELVAALEGEPIAWTDYERTIVVPPHRNRSRTLPLLLALAAVALGAIAAAILLGDEGGQKPGLAPSPAVAAPIRLRAVASYDPQGNDRSEHPERVSFATDGNRATYWETDHYASSHFGNLKSGVGLVLDAGRAMRLGRVELQTDTPGFVAEIKAGDSPSGEFTTVSSSETVQATSGFSLDVPAARRYYLIWITALPPGDEAHVNEVRAGG